MDVVRPAPETVAEFWTAFTAATGTEGEPLDVFSFGDSAEMADELAGLVLEGTKRATAGAVADYEDAGMMPRVGDLSVVHLGDGTPVAVIRTTDIRVGPLTSVTDDFAWDEGEGERTRDWWIDAHRSYFRRTFAASGRVYDDDLEVVFERFEVAWPQP